MVMMTLVFIRHLPQMKPNYLLYIFLFTIIIFRSSFINLVNNLSFYFFNQKNDLTINILNNKISYLEKEYQNLLDFKNNINISSNYTLSNVYLNNYSYDKLLINGSNYQKGDEVISAEGLIGIIKNIYDNYSEVSFIYNCKIPVKINNYEGKIINKDEENNLIIKEFTNYNNININDKVYSINNTYIGKVIKIDKEIVDTKVIVKPVNTNNINYVAVISRQV